jgi:hypothetical protein
VAHTLGDVRYRQGDFPGAMAEYDKGSAEPHAFRAFFNQGVVLNERSEKGLAEAAVPLDPAGIPADVVPGPMIAAIEKALPGLEASRGRFLEALSRESDGDARESVAALNKRMDDLREMKEELERIQEEQNEDQEGEDEQEGEDGEEEGDPSEEGDESEEGEGEGENDDSEPQEDPQDRQQEGENPDSQESDEQPAEDEPTPSEPADPQAAEPRSLSPEDVSKLLEQLEALEAKAMALERARRAARRQSVEKDW